MLRRGSPRLRPLGVVQARAVFEGDDHEGAEGFGLGSPNSSVRNSADSRLSCDATMVWLKAIGIVPSRPVYLRSYFGAVSSKAMLSGSRNSRMYAGPMSLIGSWCDAKFVEMFCRGF